MNINIDKLLNIKDELDELNDNQALFIEEDDKVKYAIVPIETYDKLEELLAFDDLGNNPNIKVIGPDVELSYEEYERVKDGIMDLVEKALRPKAEKLN